MVTKKTKLLKFKKVEMSIDEESKEIVLTFSDKRYFGYHASLLEQVFFEDDNPSMPTKPISDKDWKEFKEAM